VTGSRRHDRTGRSTDKLVRAEQELINPHGEGGWAWLPRPLLESDAWRGASIHCRRFVDFLLLDHVGHAGRENGHLQATYDQLARSGLSRKFIPRAIREAVERGLVRVTRQGGLYGLQCRRTTSMYRLTWIGTLDPLGRATNEWKSFRKVQKKSPHPHAGTAAEPSQQQKVA
jgi:hypothetical protein